MSKALTIMSRWQTADGQRIRDELMAVLRAAGPLNDIPLPCPTVRELKRLVSNLPLIDEVGDSVDFRGLEFAFGLALVGVEWPGTRFDRAIMRCNIVGNLDGAVFDYADATGCLFQGSLKNASFVGTKLQRAAFPGANLSSANFSKAVMVQCTLEDSNCYNASFVGADLRYSLCACVDFRHADLSRANLIETSLGGAKFDEETIIRDAKLAGASMDPDLRSFAENSGAFFGAPGRESYLLAGFDTMVSAMRSDNGDGRFDIAIEILGRLRDRVVADTRFDWAAALTPSVSEKLLDEILRIYQKSLVSVQ